MAGTTEGAKKAANTKGPEGRSEAAKKAAETRGHESLAEAGRKGGEHSHGGGRRGEGEEEGRR